MSDDAMKQAKTMDEEKRQKWLERFRGAHYINIVVRKNGRDYQYEGDFLKDIIENGFFVPKEV